MAINMSHELTELNEAEINFDIALVGPSKSGKSALRTQFATGTFSPLYGLTIGVDFSAQKLEGYRFSIWDVAGFEQGSAFPSKVLQRMIVAEPKVFLLVFDLSNAKTFGNLSDYITFCQEKAPTAPIILVGNKSDLKQRAVSEDEIRTFIKRNPLICDYKETSAKEASTVTNFFKGLFKYIQPAPQTVSSQPQKRGHGKRQELIDALDEYIERIKSYKDKNGQIDYARGFWSITFCGFTPFFSKESRALNRRINFNLAQNLLHDLRHKEDKSISEIFADVEQRKERYIWSQSLPDNPNFVNRSIWGELRSIISTAQEPEVINERTPISRDRF